MYANKEHGENPLILFRSNLQNAFVSGMKEEMHLYGNVRNI